MIVIGDCICSFILTSCKSESHAILQYKVFTISPQTEIIPCLINILFDCSNVKDNIMVFIEMKHFCNNFIPYKYIYDIGKFEA